MSIVGGAGGSERLWCRGRFGDALRFRGEFFGDYVIAPRTPDSDSNQYSFVAWVLADSRDRWAQIASDGGYRKYRRLKLILYDRDGVLYAIVDPTVPSESRGLRDGSAGLFPLKQWQHVAVVADGRTLHLYRNGVQTASRPSNGVISSPPGDHLLLGCNNIADDPKEFLPVSFWDGALDEVAIFHRALSANEVSHLYKGSRALSDTTGQINK